MFKPIIDILLVKKPDEWADFSVDVLYKRMEQVNANNRDLNRNKSSAPGNEVQANAVKVQINNKTDKKQKICFDFQKTGKCSKEGCKFAHSQAGGAPGAPTLPTTSPAVSGRSQDTKTSGAPQNVAGAPPKTCTRCGEGHNRKDCKFLGKCSWWT